MGQGSLLTPPNANSSNESWFTGVFLNTFILFISKLSASVHSFFFFLAKLYWKKKGKR
jgi:hypothetical protein